MAWLDPPSFLPPGLLGAFFAPPRGVAAPAREADPGSPVEVPAGRDAPASAAAEPQAAPTSLDPGSIPPTSLWGRLMPAIGADAPVLMALGGGLAGARTWGEGIGRGLTQAAQTSLEQQKLEQARWARGLTYAALVRQGASPQMAL